MTETSAYTASEAGSEAASSYAARERQSHVRHELRAPLAVIYPLLSLLKDGAAGDLTQQQRDYLEVLDRNVVRLEALVTSTVASGWTDCAAASPVPEPVALGDVAEEMLTLRRIDQPGGASVTVEAGPPPTPRAWADRDDVRQILTGLVRNAVAYAPGAGKVVVRVRVHEPGAVALDVVDQGPGMPPAELARAFEFGFRGELARELKVPGLGAGLWTCRELARRNAGELVVSSAPGAGTTATLTLPAAEGRPA